MAGCEEIDDLERQRLAWLEVEAEVAELEARLVACDDAALEGDLLARHEELTGECWPDATGELRAGLALLARLRGHDDPVLADAAARGEGWVLHGIDYQLEVGLAGPVFDQLMASSAPHQADATVEVDWVAAPRRCRWLLADRLGCAPGSVADELLVALPAAAEGVPVAEGPEVVW